MPIIEPTGWRLCEVWRQRVALEGLHKIQLIGDALSIMRVCMSIISSRWLNGRVGVSVLARPSWMGTVSVHEKRLGLAQAGGANGHRGCSVPHSSLL